MKYKVKTIDGLVEVGHEQEVIEAVEELFSTHQSIRWLNGSGTYKRLTVTIRITPRKSEAKSRARKVKHG